MITLAAPAKLNLTLRVGPLADDGYHPVDTVMATLPDVHDLVTVAPAAARSVTCPGVPERANLAWRALDALDAHVGARCAVAVTIRKVIPAEAGLGGGSSDAAATLVATNEFLELGLSDDVLERIAAKVGADVPFFVRGGVRRAGGRGERLSAATFATPMWAVLARPPFGLATARVYAMFDRLPTRAPSGLANDLWPAALALAPSLGRVARTLNGCGADRVLLCGSGSTIAGLVPSADAAARLLVTARDAIPHCWMASSRVGTRRAADPTSQ
ncbi:MAG: 4-(cytidine 5'-diphospho)-2-C-methyl-D-erythritol kinase [Actinobacteria bacterium]|nr:4-(cytidine 5'-diphospho)-2-C-methyl-D-erythritol kinase [Actinomycetota bacterium]